jgi:hypothetical protein
LKPVALFRTAQWCCIALLVTACAVILFDVIALRPRIDRDGATTDRSVSPQEERSGAAIAQPSDGVLQSTSASNLTNPDAKHFGMLEAPSAEFVKDNPDHPAWTIGRTSNPPPQVPTEFSWGFYREP